MPTPTTNPPAVRPRLSRASTASTVDLRSSRPVQIAPLSPHIPYHPPAVPGGPQRPIQHRKTLSSAADAFPTLNSLGGPPVSGAQWAGMGIGRMPSMPSLPGSTLGTPPISPRDAVPPPFPPLPPQQMQMHHQPQQMPQLPGGSRPGPTGLHTPPHSVSPQTVPPSIPGSPIPGGHAPTGPPRSGPLHPTKYPQHYSVSIYLPSFSPDWITIAQRKGNNLLIVGDNYESDGHYEWQVGFGPDARMDTLRAKFNNEHLEITVTRGAPVIGATAMSMGMNR